MSAIQRAHRELTRLDPVARRLAATADVDPATYTLDHRLRTVARSTGGDARPDLDAASLFFDLALGNNTIDIAASNCTIGDTTISWRSRWT